MGGTRKRQVATAKLLRNGFSLENNLALTDYCPTQALELTLPSKTRINAIILEDLYQPI